MPPVRCMADCNTICDYKWTKNSRYMGGQTLNVGKVSTSSAGTYICTASEGTESVVKALTLHVPCKYTIAVLRKKKKPKRDTLTNSGDSDKMPQNVAFYQGLHCLLR